MKIYILTLIAILTLRCSQKKAMIENNAAVGEKSLDSASQHLNKVDAAVEVNEKFLTINNDDTINVNGFTLIFSTSDNNLIPSIYPDQAVRGQITDSITNSHQAAMAVEKYLAPNSKNYFQTTDSTLILLFENGKITELPKWDAKREVGYNFDYYFPRENYYLIFKQYYEGSGWVLFNRKNGFRRDIIGTPYFSQNGKRIIAVSADFAYNPNGFELMTVTSDSLVHEFRVSVANWGPVSAKWINENQIVLKTIDPKALRAYILLTIKKS